MENEHPLELTAQFQTIMTVAEAEAKAIRDVGGDVTIYQVPETLPEEVLVKM